MSAHDNLGSSPNGTLSYADAGVDIDAGTALVEAIKPAAKRTMRPEVMGGLGGFGALFDLKKSGYRDPILVSGTDGVGTKLKIAQVAGKHDTIGIDLVAMCVNDLLAQGAEPLFFLDYYACGKLDVPRAASVITGIAKGCEMAGCALIGGETAEMPGMYANEDYDLAGFAVGAVEREQVLPRLDAMQAGDVLLGLASSGFHSNGYSLVRRVIERAGLRYDGPVPDGIGGDHASLAELLLEPTRIYVKSCLAAIRGGTVKGLAHITGGGLTENLPRILPETLGAEIDLAAWPLPPVFRWLQRAGAEPSRETVNEAEMLRAFNCGIGMVLVVSEAGAEATIRLLAEAGETVYRLGHLNERTSEAVIYRGRLA